MRRNESRKPDKSSSSSEGGHSLRKLKQRGDAATDPAVPVPPLDNKAGSNKSSVYERRSSKRRPSSTGSFCSVRSRIAPVAQDLEHSALIAAAASELEVDARRSLLKRRVREAPGSPTEEPSEDSTTKDRLSKAGALLPDDPAKAGAAPSTSSGTAESSQAATRSQHPPDGIASTQAEAKDEVEALASLGGPEEHCSRSEETNDGLDTLLPPPPHNSSHSYSLARHLPFLSDVTKTVQPKARKAFQVSERLPSHLCTTSDCAAHAAALGVGKYDLLGRGTKDPCLDFGEFVCSAAEFPYPWSGLPLMTQMLVDYVVQFGRQLPTVSVLAKAVLAMRTCLDTSTRSDNDIEHLLEFMQGRSFDWPADEKDVVDPRDYTRPLKALVELNVKWALPLWFDIALRPSGPQGRTIVQTSTTKALVWRKLHKEAKQLGLITSYVETFFSALISRRGAAPSFVAFVRQNSWQVQSLIFGHLSNAVEAKIRDPKLMHLRTLSTEEHLPQLRPEDWAHILQWAFNAKPAIASDDIFLATNIYVIRSMRRIFERLTARDVLFHTTLWFVQEVGPLASKTLSLFTGLSEAANLLDSVACGLHIEAVYYAALVMMSKLEFSAPQRLAVSDLLRSVMKTARDRIRIIPEANYQTRSTLEAAFINTSATAWPWGELSVLKSLEQYYGATNTSPRSAFDEWLAIRLHIQGFTGDREFTNKVFRIESSRLANYDLIDNVILLCAAVLKAPFYYTKRHERHGEAGSFPSGERLLEILWGISPCNATYDLFPTVAGLQLAHSAYVRFRYAEDDVPLAPLKNYTAEQVFFMTFCLTLCSLDGPKGWISEICNHAVKYLPAFARSFNCPPASPMSTKPVCPDN
ncbi:hypothetical protein MRX96_056273 [Rhipicephalus microplus]